MIAFLSKQLASSAPLWMMKDWEGSEDITEMTALSAQACLAARHSMA